MAKILTTKGSVAALEDLIRRAEKEVFLISYHFIISDFFIAHLKRAVEKGVIVNIVYGNYIDKEAYTKLKSMPNLKVYHYEKLHAKIFANDSKCIVGSMNFSEPSEMYNMELGVLLSEQNDKPAFEDVISHCKEIIDGAVLERPMMPKSILDENKKAGLGTRKADNWKSEDLVGYCIRTGKRIPLNHERPYSPKAYTDWQENDDGDEECEEKYDHFTGEKSQGETCKALPILNRNWNKYKKVIGSTFK